MLRITRLTAADAAVARELFLTMAAVFDDDAVPLDDGYLRALLERDSFWALAAFDDDRIVGGLTAHTVPLTTSAASVIFIYDLAVVPSSSPDGLSIVRGSGRNGRHDDGNHVDKTRSGTCAKHRCGHGRELRAGRQVGSRDRNLRHRLPAKEKARPLGRGCDITSRRGCGPSKTFDLDIAGRFG